MPNNREFTFMEKKSRKIFGLKKNPLFIESHFYTENKHEVVRAISM